jgi:signal recognition particle subunit SRP54
VILTKLDGDARGGAALSMRAVSGVPIKFVGLGEGVGGEGARDGAAQLDVFDPERMAGRILGQGDVAALAEQVASTVDRPEAERLERKVRSKQGMDLEDFLAAMRQMRRLGPLKQLAGLLPGMNAKALAAAGGADERKLQHVEAIILAMTPGERRTPAVLDGSRRRRIAQGAGRPVQEVNRLLEQFQQMRKLMKRM